MKPFLSFLERPVQYYRQWDFLIFAVITLLSVLNGQSTVFYLLYFFWWNELIRLAVDRYWYQRNKNALYETGQAPRFFESLFLVGIYWVFLVVFFGFIAAWGNKEVTMANMQVLFFYNWFFNINLVFVLFQRWYLHKKQQAIRVYFEAFNPNTIVLHIAIITGAVLLFFVVRNYQKVFTPQNTWGSVVVISPFLLLRILQQYLAAPGQQKM